MPFLARLILVACLIAVGVTAQTVMAQAAATAEHWPRMLTLLQARLDRQPNSSENWRLLGKAKHKLGDHTGAIAALVRAVELDPQSVAAHYDLGQLFDFTGQRNKGAVHFLRVVELAPGSEYANSIPSWWRPPANDTAVAPASFELTRLDGSNELQRLRGRLEAGQYSPVPTLPRYFFYLESGVQYNGNVTFTPVSQELFSSDAAAWQAFVNPDFEYRILNGNRWRHGPLLRGYFTGNERPFSDFDLQSYHAGYFGEHSYYASVVTWVSRAEYGYTFDLLGGHEFGDRHAIRFSETAIWDCGNVTNIYYSTHWSNFVNDGLNPSINSLDGWTNTFGVSHLTAIDWRFLKSITLGADVEIADIKGADYTYNGASLFADATIPLTDCLSLLLEGGWGYRDYYDFTGSPSRNESVWRGGARLKYKILDWLSVSTVLNYDRFDTPNTDFSAERWLAGVVTTILK